MGKKNGRPRSRNKICGCSYCSGETPKHLFKTKGLGRKRVDIDLEDPHNYFQDPFGYEDEWYEDSNQCKVSYHDWWDDENLQHGDKWFVNQRQTKTTKNK